MFCPILPGQQVATAAAHQVPEQSDLSQHEVLVNQMVSSCSCQYLIWKSELIQRIVISLQKCMILPGLHVCLEVLDAAVESGHVAQHDGADEVLLVWDRAT